MREGLTKIPYLDGHLLMRGPQVMYQLQLRREEVYLINARLP